MWKRNDSLFRCCVDTVVLVVGVHFEIGQGSCVGTNPLTRTRLQVRICVTVGSSTMNTTYHTHPLNVQTIRIVSVLSSFHFELDKRSV